MGPSAQTEQHRAGFAAAVGDCLPLLRRFAVTLVPPHDVEDLVQDAVYRGLQKWDTFDPNRGAVRSWLLAIVADQARRRRRAFARRGPALIDVGRSDELGPEAAPDVRAAVATLPRRQREAVVLFYYVDLSIAEIAAVLRSSPGTVKASLHAARTSLAKSLGSYRA